jgi:hypothetical protein
MQQMKSGEAKSALKIILPFAILLYIRTAKFKEK